MKKESPCKTCSKYPCKDTKNCKARYEYAKSYSGTDLMKAVDIDDSYRLVLR